MKSAVLRVGLLLLLAGVAGGAGASARADEGEDVPEVVGGTITWISQDAVEIDGRRGIIEPSTDFRSDGHRIALSSIQKGMPAEMEVAADGIVLEIRVNGVVE